MKYIILLVLCLSIGTANLSFAEMEVINSGENLEGKKIDEVGAPETEAMPSPSETGAMQPGEINGKPSFTPEAEEYLKKAREFVMAEQYAEALPYVKKALELTPQENRYSLCVILGVLDYRLNSFQDAIGAFNEALNLKPGELEIYAYLGIVYAATGQSEKAREYLSRALSGYKSTENYNILYTLFIEGLLKTLN